MKFFTALAFIATASPVFAQITFQESYGSSGAFEYSLSAVPSSDGGYVSIGNSDSGVFGGMDYMMIRTDDYGVEQWRRYYGTADWEISTGIIETNDGGFAFCGGWRGLGTDSATLIKTDGNGIVQWQKVFLPQPGRAMVQDLTELSDGSIVVAGFCGSNSLPDAFVTKFTSTGSVVWQRTYGGASVDEFLAIAEVSGTGFVMTGRTDTYGNGQSDYWVVRIDAVGDTLWTRTAGTAQDEEPYDVVTTQDGGFAIYGTENFSGGDGMLVKLNSAGVHQWTEYFDSGAGGWEMGHSLVETWDGGFALAGRSEIPANVHHMWLVRTDASGTFLWDRRFPRDYWSYGENIYETADLGFLIAGYSGNISGDMGNVYLVKTESAGWVSVEEPSSAPAFTFSQNHAEQRVSFAFSLAVPGRRVRITDMNGRIVLDEAAIDPRVDFDVSSLAAGAYVYCVYSASSLIGTGKFVWF